MPLPQKRVSWFDPTSLRPKLHATDTKSYFLFEGRGPPLAKECALKPPEPDGDRGNCVDRVSGFASKMVAPLAEFLLKVLLAS